MRNLYVMIDERDITMQLCFTIFIMECVKCLRKFDTIIPPDLIVPYLCLSRLHNSLTETKIAKSCLVRREDRLRCTRTLNHRE